MSKTAAEKVAKEPPAMDIYIRMNEDCEQDYCFNVPTDKPVSWLHKIFETLPMVLSPSYFYNPMPVGFAVSTQAGFLTSEGGLLFQRNAHEEKYLKKIDQNAKIQDVCIEGQLIIPIWQYNYTRWIKVLTILGAWLYLDFPEYLNPTPGYAPSTIMIGLFERLMPSLKDDSPSNFSGIWWQWGFFTLHILKCGFIYLILWVGGVNPVSFNPIKNRRVLKKEMTRDLLLEIGWTSARRATPSEWREENRKAKIEQHGGVVAAYHAGVLEGIGRAGVDLGAGEGWDTEGKNPSKETAVDDDKKFKIDKEYMSELYRTLAVKLTDPEVEDEQKSALIKQFRRGGPEVGSEKIRERYEARKALEKTE